MLHFKLVTPDRTLFEEEAASVTLPTAQGEITILPHHMPLVAVLVAGVAKLVQPNGHAVDIAVSSGFIQADQGQVTVLAHTAEKGEELTLDAIKVAQERARDLMKQTKTSDEKGYALAAAAMERELARYKTATRHRNRRSSSLPEKGQK